MKNPRPFAVFRPAFGIASLVATALAIALPVACRSELSAGSPANANEPAPTPPVPAAVVTPTAVDPVANAGIEYRIAPDERPVYARPVMGTALRGTIGKNEPFAVYDRVPGTGCAGEGWAKVDADGFVCLANTKVSADHPVAQPRLVAFDPPTPDEFFAYRDTGVYHRDPVDASSALTPNVYGKPWRHWEGTLYKDLASYEAGSPSIGKLSKDRKHHFVDAVDTARGTVLVEDNGNVSPADDVWIYPVSRHHGRDLVANPLPDGMWQAWTINYEGALVHRAPSADSEVGAILPHHTPLLVSNVPADASGHWWTVPHALGSGVPGYVEDQETIRHPSPRPDRPPGVRDDEVWIDVDIPQQYLHVYRGDQLIYVSLVATGQVGFATPRGVYRLTGKNVTWDMSSRPDGPEYYYVEDVPWTMHFRPRYALHGVYWHWGFGRIASHGCVNLSPIDAKWVFDHTDPHLPDGWEAIYPTAEDQGTTVRIRYGTAPVDDKREQFANASAATEIGGALEPDAAAPEPN